MDTPLITLTTDFGDGGYVAQMKGVILGIRPGTGLVDICHTVPPGNIAEAAWLLRDVVEAFDPTTIHVAVVDPGVGSGRGLIAAETAWGRFVAPDNGLLTLIMDDCPGGPRAIHRLTCPAYWRPHVAATFHGRDILAPVAAWIARGTSLMDLGPALDASVRLPLPRPIRAPRDVRGEVVRVDHFGNLITNVSARDLPDETLFPSTEVRCDDIVLKGIWRYYAEGTPREPLALIGSNARLEIAIPGDHAAKRLAKGIGAPVVVRW